MGCAERDVGPLPEAELSCEISRGSHQHKGHATADMLLVIDRSPGMAAHAETLERGLRALGEHLEYSPDLHIAMVAADAQRFTAEAQLLGCFGPTGSYLLAEREFWFRCGDDSLGTCPLRNFSSPLAEAMPCIGALQVEPGADRQILRAAVDSLDAAPTDFRRPRSDALLVTIISSGDDQSPGGLEDYAEALVRHAGAYSELIVTVIAPLDATRLHDLPRRVGQFYSPPLTIDDDWVEYSRSILDYLSQDILPYSCLRWDDSSSPNADPGDRDPENPGIQPNCVATPLFEWNRAGLPLGEIVPPCRMATPTRPHPETSIPCWWMESDEAYGCELHPRSEGISYLQWHCESEC